jgi:hypothetical protein
MKSLLLAITLFLCAPLCWGATPAQYTQALGAVRRSVDAEIAAYRQGGPAPTPPASAVARAQLQPIHAVQSQNGRVYPVDSHPLIAELVSDEGMKDRKAAAERLDAVSAHLSALETQVDASASPRKASEAKAAAREVLSRPEFQSEPAPDPSAFEKASDTVIQWLQKHWPKWRPAGGPSWSPNIKVIYGILFVLLVALFALLVWVIVGAVGRRAVRSRPLAVNDTEAALVEARDTDSILDLADEKARGGDFRSAFRLIYLATLVTLDTGGVLRFDRSKTNWEYLRALRAAGRSDVYEAMRPLTLDFDRLWYGLAKAGPEDYQRARRQYQELTESAAETAGAKR